MKLFQKILIESVDDVNNQYHEELLKNQELRILLIIFLKKMKFFFSRANETSEDEDENQ